MYLVKVHFCVYNWACSISSKQLHSIGAPFSTGHMTSMATIYNKLFHLKYFKNKFTFMVISNNGFNLPNS